jgi:hypothetical protein
MPDLKEAVKALGHAPRSGPKATVAAQLFDNLHRMPAAPNATTVQLKVLDKWFLDPKFSGSDACRVGLDNEKPIFSMLPAWVASQKGKLVSVSPCTISGAIQDVDICSLRDVGLVESKELSIMTCSTDHLGMLTVSFLDGSTYDGPCVMELKTKATPKTVLKENEQLASGDLKPWVHVFDAASLKQYVREPEHRVQTMHHMATYDARFCLYVVAEKGRVLRCVLIESTSQNRQAYRDAVSALWAEYMLPFESVNTIPAGINDSNLGFLASVENLKCHISYRKGLRQLVREEGCLPPAKHTLTFFQALWNPLKGGTDQHSRAMEETHGRWENYLQPTQRSTVRTLKTSLINAFHAFRLCRCAMPHSYCL